MIPTPLPTPEEFALQSRFVGRCTDPSFVEIRIAKIAFAFATAFPWTTHFDYHRYYPDGILKDPNVILEVEVSFNRLLRAVMLDQRVRIELLKDYDGHTGIPWGSFILDMPHCLVPSSHWDKEIFKSEPDLIGAISALVGKENVLAEPYFLLPSICFLCMSIILWTG